MCGECAFHSLTTGRVLKAPHLGDQPKGTRLAAVPVHPNKQPPQDDLDEGGGAHRKQTRVTKAKNEERKDKRKQRDRDGERENTHNNHNKSDQIKRKDYNWEERHEKRRESNKRTNERKKEEEQAGQTKGKGRRKERDLQKKERVEKIQDEERSNDPSPPPPSLFPPLLTRKSKTNENKKQTYLVYWNLEKGLFTARLAHRDLPPE